MVGVRDNCVRAYVRMKSCMRMHWRTFMRGSWQLLVLGQAGRWNHENREKSDILGERASKLRHSGEIHQHLRKGQVEDAKQKGPRQTRQFALPASRSGEHLSSLPSLVTQNVL